MAAVSVISCQKESNGTAGPLPEININPSGEIHVSGEKSEDLTIGYEIVNPVKDGKLDIEPSVEWITVLEDTGSELKVRVETNGTEDERCGILVISYIYGENKSVDREAVIIQGAGVNYDYVQEATVITAYYYGDRNSNNGEHNFDTYLSSKPFDEDGYPMSGAFYYRLDFWSPAPGDASAPLPAAGTYDFGEMYETAEFTFTNDFSYYVIYDDQGEISLTSYFYDGTVTIDYEGENIIIDAVLTDETYNYVHHVTYAGPVEYTVL